MLRAKRNRQIILNTLSILIVLLFSVNSLAEINFDFLPPTLIDGTILDKGNTEINLSITGNITDLGLNWNGGNNNIFDNHLLLLLNFNNNPLLGENATEVADVSQYSNNGRLVNGASLINNGKFGGAVSFDGVDDFIDLRKPLLGPGGFSIEFWAKPSSIRNNIVLSQGMYATLNSDDLLNIWASMTGQNIDISSSSYYPLGTFSHFAFVYNNETNTSKIYVNGHFDNEKPASGNLNSMYFNINTQIGKHSNNYFQGILDEFRIYNRPLTENEISMLYNSELSMHNSREWIFYNNITDLSNGLYTYYLSAKDNTGITYQSDTIHLNFPCIVPTSGMKISVNTIFCKGTYYLSASRITNETIILSDNVVLEGNNTLLIGDQIGYCLHAEDKRNVTIRNLSIRNYDYAVFLENTPNSTIKSITSDKARCGVFFDYSSINSTIKNSIIENYSENAIMTYSNYTSIYGNKVGFHSPELAELDPKGIKIENSYSVSLENNFISTVDYGISLERGNKNIILKNNTLTNATLNTDGFNAGIVIFENNSDIILDGNNITKAGTVGILLIKNNSGISIINNYIDLFDSLLINQTLAQNFYEPPMGIHIAEVYQRWLTDCSETKNDGIKKITNYKSHNIKLVNNTFGSNVPIFLRVQGGDNLSEDLGLPSYWYRKIQFPNSLLDADEFYISIGSNPVQNYYHGTNENFIQGMGIYIPEIDRGKMRNMIQYKLNRSSLFFRNMNDSIVYNITLFVPNNVLFNVSNLAYPDRVNVSLPTNMQWYHTINYTVSPASGIVSVYVSNYTQDSVKWGVSNVEGSGALSYLICGLRHSSVYDLKLSGSRLLGILSDESGCVAYSSSERVGSYALVYNASGYTGEPADLSVISADISLSSSAVVVNDVVNITARIYNSGGLPVNGVSVKCFDGSPASGILIGEAFLDVPAGSHSYAVFSWTASPKWTHGIYIVVDSANQIAESNENNNLAYRNIYVYDLPDLSIAIGNILSIPSVVYTGVSVVVRAVVVNLGEAPVSSFLVRFLEEGNMLSDQTVSVNGGGNVSVDASWVPQLSGSSNITVSVDPLGTVLEKSESNNIANKAFNVLASTTVPGASTTSFLSSTTTMINYPPLPPGQTTTTLNGSCVMSGNAPPCDVVSLVDVVSGINGWAQGGIELIDVIALINSWADPVAYPPV